MKVLEWLLKNDGVAVAFLAVVAIAWVGWHRTPPAGPPLAPQIIQVQPGQTKIVTVTVPGAPAATPEQKQTVTSPVPGVHVIQQPAPVPMTPAQEQQTIAKAPEHISVEVKAACVNGQVKPDCGPIAGDGHIEIVRGDAGAIVIQTPEQAKALTVGGVTTEIHSPPPPPPFHLNVGAGLNSLGQTFVRLQPEYDFKGPFGLPMFVQANLTVPTTSVLNSNIAGIQGDIWAGITIPF